MTDKPLTVANDIVVTLEYTLRLDDGDVVSTSEDGGPLEFIQGRGEKRRLVGKMEKNSPQAHTGLFGHRPDGGLIITLFFKQGTGGGQNQSAGFRFLMLPAGTGRI